MTLRRTSLALAVVIAALASTSEMDSVSAQSGRLNKHFIVEHDWPIEDDDP